MGGTGGGRGGGDPQRLAWRAVEPEALHQGARARATTHAVAKFGRVWQHGGDEVVVLRTDESHAVPGLGRTIHVQPRPGKMHWFDAASGQRKDTP